MELVLIPAIAAFVELLRRVKANDWFAVLTITGSGLIGLLLGVLHAPGVADGWTGLIGGLAAAGVVTIVSRNGTSSSVSEKTIVR